MLPFDHDVAVGVVVALGVPVAGFGASAAGAVAGGTTPTIFSFCFFPIVPRAARVAWRRATPRACASTVVDLFFGVKPKSATGGDRADAHVT